MAILAVLNIDKKKNEKYSVINALIRLMSTFINQLMEGLWINSLKLFLVNFYIMTY